MSVAPSIVTYHGARFSAVFRDAVAEWHRLAAAERIPFTITQGGHNRGGVAASAGTHDGDAIDLSVRGLTQHQVTRLIHIGRMLGFAAWFRTKHAQWGTPAHGFSVAHIHAVPNGWGHPSAGAVAQAASYRIGRDGLAGNRVDAGPGHTGAYRSRTWHGYLAALGAQDYWQREFGMSKQEVEAMFERVLDKKLRQQGIGPAGAGAYWGSSFANNAGHAAAHARNLDRGGVRAQANSALWDKLIPGADGVAGSSVRNNIHHIEFRTAWLVEAVAGIASMVSDIAKQQGATHHVAQLDTMQAMLAGVPAELMSAAQAEAEKAAAPDPSTDEDVVDAEIIEEEG